MTISLSPNVGASLAIVQRNLNYNVSYAEQRAVDGINNIVREWTVAFTDSPIAVAALEDTLTALQGIYTFSWTPPQGLVGNWRCESFSTSQDNFGQATLSTIFSEIF